MTAQAEIKPHKAIRRYQASFEVMADCAPFRMRKKKRGSLEPSPPLQDQPPRTAEMTILAPFQAM